METMKQHGINVVAWWFPGDPADPTSKTILEVNKQNGIHPQLWVTGGGGPTKSDAEQTKRVAQETARIRALVEFAAPYGSQVELYNHDGWFGRVTNEVAIIKQLKAEGVDGVGMIYNFTHGHEDIANFPVIWNEIKPYVVAVNISGMFKLGPGASSGPVLPPGQGDCELAMMRTIQQSGWHGPVGVIAEQGGDAKVSLSNDLRGLDWLKKELVQPGSGGERPNFSKTGAR
jgi:sugar phosphate isomerase/epimerase